MIKSHLPPQAPVLPATYSLAGGTLLKRYSDTRYTELFSHPVFVQRLLENFVEEDSGLTSKIY
jgi:hypothetical protein